MVGKGKREGAKKTTISFNANKTLRIFIKWQNVLVSQTSTVHVTHDQWRHDNNEPRYSLSYKTQFSFQAESLRKALSNSQWSKASSGGQQRLGSDCADAQADLSLCWTHMQSWYLLTELHLRIAFLVGVMYNLDSKCWDSQRTQNQSDPVQEDTLKNISDKKAMSYYPTGINKP